MTKLRKLFRARTPRQTSNDICSKSLENPNSRMVAGHFLLMRTARLLCKGEQLRMPTMKIYMSTFLGPVATARDHARSGAHAGPTRR